jgi:hypothetical protein
MDLESAYPAAPAAPSTSADAASSQSVLARDVPMDLESAYPAAPSTSSDAASFHSISTRTAVDDQAKPKSYATKESLNLNTGKTDLIMTLLAESWLVAIFFILGGTYIMTFKLPQYYIDDQLWNVGCWWKLGIFD